MTELNGTTFLSGANAEFIAELYARYLDDPNAIDPSWRRFFAEMADDAAAIRAERARPGRGRCRRSSCPRRRHLPRRSMGRLSSRRRSIRSAR